MANQVEFAAAMALLYTAYPSTDSTEPRNELYYRMLSDIPGPMLLAAAQEHIAQSKWFPTVAELRVQALAMKHTALGYVSGEIAYIEAQTYYNSGGQVKPSNEYVLAALHHIGGIWAIRTSDRPEWTRKAYIDTYNALISHAKAGQDMLPSSKEIARQVSLDRARREAEGLLEAPQVVHEDA